MSRGALLQLVAKSEADEYLIDKDISNSLFRHSINKITNFSEVPYSFFPSGISSWGGTVIFTIKKVGDLLTNMYLVLELPPLSVTDITNAQGTALNQQESTSTLRVKWNEYIGNAIIENVILRIGGQKIDEHTGEYMQFITDLYDTTWSKLCMLGHDSSLVEPQLRIEKQFIYIPLQFFFCNDISKALPIIALEHHEIEIEIKLRQWEFTHLVLSEVENDISGDPPNINEVSRTNYSHTPHLIPFKNFSNLRLDCNFIFLDVEERKYVAATRHEILITQAQQQTTTCKSNDSLYLNFTNPIKELIFVFQKPSHASLGEIYNYSGKPEFIPLNNGAIVTNITDRLWNQIPDKHLLDSANLEFDGNERVPTRDYKYWHFVQNYEHYRNHLEHNIYMYSFGLSTRENQGSCNFSMIQSVRLNVTLATTDRYPTHYIAGNDLNIDVGAGNTVTAKIYATNYNVFVVEKGLGAVMYAM